MNTFKIVQKEKIQFTMADLKEKFPTKKNTITPELVRLLNDASSDPMFNGDEFMKTLVDYQSCMIECASSMREYINAVKFCAYLESENNNAYEAYKKSRKHDPFVLERKDDVVDSPGYNAIVAAASRYRKNPLVRQILTQSDMPLYLMFQGSRFKAVAVLAREMEEAAYSKDRINAADKLLSHVKPPENINVEMKIGQTQEVIDVQAQLNEQLAQIAANQKALMSKGSDIRDVQNLGLNFDTIDAEIE